MQRTAWESATGAEQATASAAGGAAARNGCSSVVAGRLMAALSVAVLALAFLASLCVVAPERAWADDEFCAVYSSGSKALWFVEGNVAANTVIGQDADGNDVKATTVWKNSAYHFLDEDKRYTASATPPWYGQRNNITTVRFASETRPYSTAYWFYNMVNLTALENFENLKAPAARGDDGIRYVDHMFLNCSKLTSLSASDGSQDLAWLVKPDDLTYMVYGCTALKAIDFSHLDSSAAIQNTACADLGTGSCYSLAEIVTGEKWSNAGFESRSAYNTSCFPRLIVWTPTGAPYSTILVSTIPPFVEGYEAPCLSEEAASEMDWASAVTTDNGYTAWAQLGTGTGTKRFDASASSPGTLVIPSGARRYVNPYQSSTEEERDDNLQKMFGTYVLWCPYDDGSGGELLFYRYDGKYDMTDVWDAEAGDTVEVDDGQGGTTTLTVGAVYTFSSSSIFANQNAQPWASVRTQVTKARFMTNYAPECMAYWFSGCTKLTGFEQVGNLNCSAATSMAYMFNGCTTLEECPLPLEDVELTSVTAMTYMFNGCTKLAGLQASDLSCPSLANASYMFYNCTGLKSVSMQGFEADSLTNVECMFQLAGAEGSTCDLSNWSLPALESTYYMFLFPRFESVSLSGWSTPALKRTNHMFLNYGNGNNPRLRTVDRKRQNTRIYNS